MEILDVINEKDEVIGTATREQCHADSNLLHRTAHFTLIDRDNKKVFITQRSFNKNNDGGLWCFAGEHMLAGETYNQAVYRGLQEEFGISVSQVLEGAHHIFSYDTQRELVRFFVGFWKGEEILVDPKEIIDTKWLSLEELSRDLDSYSQMTQYWLRNVDFKFFLEN